MADAEKALNSTQNMKFGKREIRAEFCQTQKSDLGEGACLPAFLFCTWNTNVADLPEIWSRLRLTIKILLKTPGSPLRADSTLSKKNNCMVDFP